MVHSTRLLLLVTLLALPGCEVTPIQDLEAQVRGLSPNRGGNHLPTNSLSYQAIGSWRGVTSAYVERLTIRNYVETQAGASDSARRDASGRIVVSQVEVLGSSDQVASVFATYRPGSDKLKDGDQVDVLSGRLLNDKVLVGVKTRQRLVADSYGFRYEDLEPPAESVAITFFKMTPAEIKAGDGALIAPTCAP